MTDNTQTMPDSKAIAEYIDATPPPRRQQGERLHELAAMRRDPDAIRHAFETGEYPYQTKLSRRIYEDQKKALQVELLKVQKWVKESANAS